MYRLIFTTDAQKDLKQLAKKAPTTMKKLAALLEEIKIHPRRGTG